MRRLRPYLRRAAQVGVIALIVAIPIFAYQRIDFALGSLCSVGYGSFRMTCGAGALQISLAARAFHLPLWLSVLPFIVLAVVLGRVFCSWICPQGTLSETMDRVRRWIRRRERPAPDSPPRQRRGKIVLFSVLGVTVAGSFLLGVPVFCYVCPVGILCRSAVSMTFLGKVGAEIAIVGLILVAELVIARRGWCKYICPIGAIYGLCTTPWSLRITRRSEACVSCGTCGRECPMGNAPLEGRVAITCTNCGVCLQHCPEGALDLRLGPERPAGKITFEV